MLYYSWQKDHKYRGFMLVKNYSCFANEIAQKSSHSIEYIVVGMTVTSF
jgi:hypothetical protein